MNHAIPTPLLVGAIFITVLLSLWRCSWLGG